jgi:hypothetical protein
MLYQEITSSQWRTRKKIVFVLIWWRLFFGTRPRWESRLDQLVSPAVMKQQQRPTQTSTGADDGIEIRDVSFQRKLDYSVKVFQSVLRL